MRGDLPDDAATSDTAYGISCAAGGSRAIEITGAVEHQVAAQRSSIEAIGKVVQ